jgi:hypothetical protein
MSVKTILDTCWRPSRRGNDVGNRGEGHGSSHKSPLYIRHHRIRDKNIPEEINNTMATMILRHMGSGKHKHIVIVMRTTNIRQTGSLQECQCQCHRYPVRPVGRRGLHLKREWEGIGGKREALEEKLKNMAERHKRSINITK